MHSLLLDFQSALRFFARRRAAFAVIVLTMALALGANTAVFSVLKSFLFASLAVPEAERVVVVPTTKELPGRGRVDFSDAYPNYQLLRQSIHSFESIGTTLTTDANWEQADDTRRLQGLRATASFFDVMRLRPVIGRLFTAKEEGPKAAPVVLISHSLWRSAFGGSPAVLGQSLRLNGAPHTIIGVLPAGFSQPIGTDVWLPFDLPPEMWTPVIGGRQLSTYARLAPGVTVRAANEELRIFARHAVEVEPNNKDWLWRAQPLRENILSGADRSLLLVQAGACVLLVLAISNLASLLMAWAAERQRETAVRLALGASGWRLIRQFLVQSVVLVAIGGVLGVVLAALSLPALQRLNPNRALAVFLEHLELDRETLGVTALLVLGAGLLAGLLPAWQARSVSFNEALRSESRGASLGRGALRWQQAMVVLQAAVSVLILVGAGLAGLGFYRLGRAPLGFATPGRVVMQIQFPEPAYGTHEKRALLANALEQNLAREPSLVRWGISTTIPVGDFQWGAALLPQLPSGEFSTDQILVHYRRVSPTYLATMGVPLLEGRMLNEHDRAETPAVAVVSKALAEKYWPGQSALGRKLHRVSAANAPIIEVVGVVGNVKDAGAGLPAGEAVYIPFAQVSLRRVWIVLQGRGSTADTLAAGRRALRNTAPEIAAYNTATLDELAWQANALPRLQFALLGVFAVIAIGITTLGSYGVMSQLVANRQREMAIRSALGASPTEVLRRVLWQNARLALSGAAAGLLAAWFGAHALQAQLAGFDAKPWWPYVTVAAIVLAVTQLASYLPARRASKLDLPSVLSGAN